MNKVTFKDFGLSPQLLRALEKKQFETPTPVQAGCIPNLMEWKDIIAKAPTGTGKTLAFGIPMIEHVDPTLDQVQGLILCPTRELALQISSELRALAEFRHGVRIVSIYGGQAIINQIKALKKQPQIIVATPGRLGDHLSRRTIRLDSVETVVLDEADRMLDMGFVKEVTRILDLMPQRKNLALLSATISREVMDISWVYQRDAVEVTVPEDVNNKPDILQYSLEAVGSGKTDAITRILKAEGYERVIVFCNTKHMVKKLTKTLNAKGHQAGCIHGDVNQSARERVIGVFRKGALNILVATDVAARGLDIDGVDAVFNYDLPNENEYYVHRIGRTGRAKKHGVSYTFVSYYDTARLKEIMRYAKAQIIPLRFDKDYNLCPASSSKRVI